MSADLKANVFPTTHDLLKYYLYLKEESLKKKPRGLLSRMVDDVMQAWETSSLPTLSKPRVTKLMRKRLDQYFDLKKNLSRKESENFKKKLGKLHKSIGTLFDISTCKCTNFATCACSRKKKVPVQKQQFLSDQRTVRKMYIGSIDKRTTKRNEKTLQRKIEDKSRSTTKSFLSVDTADIMESSSTSKSSEDSDRDFENNISRKFKQPALISKPPPKSLPNFAAACGRTDVSCRAAAMIVSVALDDIEGKNANVIDKNKVTKEKQKSRKQYMDSNENANIISLYFDGRKDRTLLMEELETKRTRREVIEEHITVLVEPGSTGRYLGHFSPSSGTAKNIANSLMEFCKDKQIDINKIQAIGCDGTNTNVG